MRNLKRYLSIAIAIAMMVTLMAPAMAATDSTAMYSSEASKLNAMGLYKGISETTFNPDLTSTLDRQTGAVMLLRMFGLEQEALATDEADAKATLSSKFKDAAKVAPWALKQVAFAVDAGVIKGYPDGNFNPTGLLKGSEYCTLVLKQLGYEVPKFEEVAQQFADVAGLTDSEAAAFGVNAAIKKDILVGISFKALSTKLDSKTTTLIEELVKNGTVTKAAAEAAGFVITATATPTAVPTSVYTTPTPTSVPGAVYGLVNTKVEFKPARSVAVITGTQGEALVDIASATFTAEKDSTIYGITLTRSGLSGDNDIDGVTVWDGANKISSSSIFSNSKCVINFFTPLQVKAGETKVVAIRADINKSAPAGAQLVFSVNSLSDINAGTATVNGTFPVTSGAFQVVALSANSLGTLTVTVAGDSPAAGDIDPSTKDVTLAKFKFTSANEALSMKSIIITNNGTSSESDVTNLRLYNGSTLVSDTVEKFVNRKAAFSFKQTTDIEKGGNVVLTLKGDVTSSGANRTIVPMIDKTTDVLSIGKTYGTNIVAAAAGTATETAKTLTIAKGSLVVSLDSSSPAAGKIKKDSKKQFLGAFKIQSTGESVQVTKINIKATAVGFNVSAAVTALVLENQDGTNLANLSNPFTAGAVTEYEYVTITPQTVKVDQPLVVKAYVDINNDATIDVDTDTLRIGVGDDQTKDIEAKGIISGEDTNVNLGSPINASIMTIGNIGITPAYIPFASSDYAFTNETEHVVAKLGLSSNLASEDVTVSTIELALNAPGGTAANVANTLKNMKLKDTAGNVISNIKATPSASGNQFTFKTPVVLKNGSAMFGFNVVADLASSIVGGENDYTVSFGTITATGVKTGNDIATLTASGSPSTGLFGTAVAAGNLTLIHSVIQDVGDKNVIGGSTNVKLAGATLSNAAQEVVKLNKIRIKTTYAGTLNAGHLTNVKLVDVSNKVLASLDSLTSGVKDVTLDTPLECKKSVDGTTEISLLADVVGGAPAGGTVKVLWGDADGAGATTDLEYTGKSSSETVVTANVSDSPAQGDKLFTVTPSKVDVTAVAISNPIGTATAQPVNGIEIARFTFKNSGTESIALKNISLDDVLADNKFLGQVDHAITLYNTEEGTALSAAVTANATNALNIPLTSIKAIAPNGTLTVSVKVSTAGTLAASPSASLRVLEATTTYVKTSSATLAGGPPAVVTGTGYSVDNSVTANTITVIKQ